MTPQQALAYAEGDTWDPLDPIIGVGNVEVGDGRHGHYSDTHNILGILKRSPHHHHHHDRHGHHKVVVTGSNDHVNVHERSYHDNSNGGRPDGMYVGASMGVDLGPCQTVRGRRVRCPSIFDSSMKKRDDSGSNPGVPGTVDIMVRFIYPCHRKAKTLG